MSNPVGKIAKKNSLKECVRHSKYSAMLSKIHSTEKQYTGSVTKSIFFN